MAKDEISARVTLEGGKEVTKELQGIGKEADKLDGTKIELPIEADTKKADRDIAGLMSKVDKLSSDAGTILLTSNATEIAGEITDLIIDIDRLDASDPEVDVKATQIDALKGDLDQIEAKIREVNNVPVEVDTRRATAGIDQIGKSAGSSKSVLANMVGNATQDVGSLAGVAGSAGVAIGQMGEYMVDAAADGDKFSTVVANFAKVAGPIAAIATVLSIVQGVMATNAERAKKAAEATKEYGDAMADSANDAVGLTDVLRGNIADMREFAGAATESGDIVKEVFSNVPLIGGLLKDAPVDVLEVMNDIGVGFFQLGKAIGGNVHDWDAIQAKLKQFHDLGAITDNQFKQTTRFVNEQRDAVKDGEEAQQFQNIAIGEANALYDEMLAKKQPLSEFPEVWNTVFDAIRNGTLDSKKATDAINLLHTELGISPSDVLALGLEEVDKKQQDAAKSAQELADKQRDLSGALDNITADWKEMADEISEKSFSEALDQFDAVSELDLSQVRQDTVGAFDAVKEAIKTAAGEVKGWGKMDLTPDSFEELKGMPAAFADITDAVSGMRGSIQTELKAAFDTGGVQAFSEKFDFFAQQVRQQFTDLFRGMGLPEDQVQAQVQRILGDLSLLPESKTILIKLTRDQEAKNTLDLFMADIATIENANPSVDIRAKIAEGDIEGAYDELNALRISEGKEPIVLPTDAEQFGATTAAANARTRAQNYLNQHPALVPVGADGRNVPSDTMNARNAGQNTANANPIVIPVAIGGGQYRLPSGQIIYDAGGTVGPAGGIAAERGPEILNGRYLATRPTVVPPGTRVTSRRRTARVLRHNGTRGLKAYDSGGTVAAGPSTVNVNFNGVGAIGSRFDLMRTVKRANLDKTRLLGTRG